MIPVELLYKLAAWIGLPLLSILGLFIYGKVQKSKGLSQGKNELLNEYRDIAHDKQSDLHTTQAKVYDEYETHINSSDDWTDDELRNAETRHGNTSQEPK